LPFTPLHCGPGALIKALIPGWFSLSIFTLVQVLIDIESLYNLINGYHPVHAFFHSYLGASIIGVIGVVLGKPIIEQTFKIWNFLLHKKPASRLYIGPKIPLKSSIIGSFVGVYSHVLLDSIMHSDIRPLAPFSETNLVYQIIAILPLHALCFSLGIIGVFWLLHLVQINGFKK